MIDQPQKDPMFDQYTQEINAAYRGEGGVALAMVTQKGAMSGEVGTKLLIREDGSRVGSLGDDSLDDAAEESAFKAMDFGRQDFMSTKDGTEIYVEAFTSPATVVLVGGGHVSYAIYKLATFLGYRTRVVDDREQFGNAERFPEADKIVVGEYDSGIRDVGITANSFVVVATRGSQVRRYGAA